MLYRRLSHVFATWPRATANGAVCVLALFLTACESLDRQIETPPTTQLTQPQIDRIDLLFSRYGENTPGASVGVVRRGELVFQRHYGTANLDYGQPITHDTVFNIGSVTKQFTAYALFLLNRDGTLSLTDSVRKFIPELPAYAEDITLRQLANHTSGVTSHMMLSAIAGWRRDDALTREHILHFVVNQEALDFEPGTSFSYSNSGYVLLAEVIARATGMSFADVVEKRIFSPLEMDHSTVYDNASDILPNRAESYFYHDGNIGRVPLTAYYAGSTGIYSTVGDMAKWASHLQNPPATDVTLIKDFNEVARLNSGEPAILTVVNNENVYGASGQFKRRYRGATLYNHSGGDAGYRSYFGRFPTLDTSVIALGNDLYFDSFPTGLAIADIVLQSDLQPARDAPPATTRTSNREHGDEPGVDQLAGRYQSDELSTFYDVIAKDGVISLYHARHGNIKLEHLTGDTYSARIVYGYKVTFVRDDNGRAQSLIFSNSRVPGAHFLRID